MFRRVEPPGVLEYYCIDPYLFQTLSLVHLTFTVCSVAGRIWAVAGISRQIWPGTSSTRCPTGHTPLRCECLRASWMVWTIPLTLTGVIALFQGWVVLRWEGGGHKWRRLCEDGWCFQHFWAWSAAGATHAHAGDQSDPRLPTQLVPLHITPPLEKHSTNHSQVFHKAVLIK